MTTIILWQNPSSYLMTEKVFFSCASRCANDRWSCSKWNYNWILITFFVKTYLDMIFGDTVSENKRFALDIHIESKYSSLIPINEHWAASSPWFKNACIKTHFCSNEFVKTNFIQLMYLSLVSQICQPAVMIIQGFFPIFSCIIFPLIVNWWYICFVCGINKIIRSNVCLNWLTDNINNLFNIIGSRTFMCGCWFKSDLLQWLVIKNWY